VHDRKLNFSATAPDDLEAISPVRIYRFQISEADVSCADGVVCFEHLDFLRLGDDDDSSEEDEAMVVAMVCPTLDGETCGTYGISLTTHNGDNGGEKGRETFLKLRTVMHDI
jgi:hypothetical protein